MLVFTVFTPTYNRAHLLHRVYASLCSQTFRDFEWLIVDDGSSDNTSELVAAWCREAAFEIRYIKQMHGHKKTAFNRGVREARGLLFLPWDSDDTAVPEALEIFYHHWLAIPDLSRENFVGVCGLCIDDHGDVIGTSFPSDVFDSNSLESRYRFKVRGEKWGFSRTDVLRQFPFPEYFEGHVPEGVVWSSISRLYQTRYINVPLRIYFQEKDSITQSSTTASVIQRNSYGHMLWARHVLEEEMDWFWCDPLWFFRMAVNYNRFRQHQKSQLLLPARPLRGIWARILSVVAWPAAKALCHFDNLR